MSILIKGVEIPTNCTECKLVDSEYCTCVLMEFYNDDYYVGDFSEKRAPWCPLVPIPPHGRLIDADALVTKIIEIIEAHNYDDFYAKSLSVGAILRSVVSELDGTALQGFNNAPTIIEAEEGE